MSNYGPGGAGKTGAMDMCLTTSSYANRIADCVSQTEIRDGSRQHVYLNDAMGTLKQSFKDCHARGNKVILLGNGGSSAIASHMAIDFTKNGGIRAVSLNDFPTLTCLSNDFGYNHVFSKQLEYYARPGDVVVCISTGGKSQNIRNAAHTATVMGLPVYTFSGMHDDNPLRSAGILNFYVRSFDYGIVEISHLTLLHFLCPCRI